jgi:hypothetical protein
MAWQDQIFDADIPVQCTPASAILEQVRIAICLFKLQPSSRGSCLSPLKLLLWNRSTCPFAHLARQRLLPLVSVRTGNLTLASIKHLTTCRKYWWIRTARLARVDTSGPITMPKCRYNKTEHHAKCR